MSKHTPGPWEVRIPSSTAARHPVYIVGGDLILAAISVPGGAYEDLRVAHANARLIAAAPAMLEALEEMLEVHGVRWEHVRGGSSIPASWVELSDKARAAIKAAKGEA